MTALILATLLAAASPQPAASPAAQTRARSSAPATTTLAVTVTDGAGAPLEGVTVTVIGPVDREARTNATGTLRLPGLRAGTYRVRFAAEGFFTFEKEVAWRAGQPAPEATVTLTAAPPPPPPPPPAPPEPPAPVLPPPGIAKTMVLPDFIEANFIQPRDTHKENLVGCSGDSQALLWQIREPWEGRQHPSADAMLYVIGGEGTLHLAGSDVLIAAGSFAVVPRGSTYGFQRRGRNPLIVLAVLAGAPCAAG